MQDADTASRRPGSQVVLPVTPKRGYRQAKMVGSRGEGSRQRRRQVEPMLARIKELESEDD